ncbi:hypothetical protein KKC13_00040 [bacterium]|nr:hypothetical protein [bacterium]MBU1957516.1 hypothetical protein [bacterium]
MSSLNYLTLFVALFFISGCSAPEENKKEENKKEESKKEESTKQEKVIPEKITMLFVTQPNCLSCDKLEKVMQLEKPKKLIENYFEIKKIYLGEKLPDGLIPPNGTPTVYFLGSNDEVLVEPIIGEKDETALMEFLDDSLYEFNITYGVDIRDLKKQNIENKL